MSTENTSHSVEPPTPRLEPPTADETVPVSQASHEGVVAIGEGEAATVAEEHTVVIRPGMEGATLSTTTSGRSPTEDYAICGKIGDGGMGVVYLARDRRLGRYVAIKRLNERALADPILRSRFLHEARAVAALNHAYIVHIYALGEDALGPYIVMEYVSGPANTEVVSPEGKDQPPPKNLTLEQYINRHGPMSAEEAVAMLLKIARTIVYAHSCGVIHRDLKPANILLDPTEEPKLVDFGLARITPRNGARREEELTVPGEKLISLGYSAPELEQDASTSDGRADIYSLGAILYFLLTGRNPRYYREQDVPSFLREVLRRSLETVREQRYRSAQDFAHALSEAANHGKVTAPTIKTTWRCKWCDAVNPITTKFCAECGWDGSEHCLECGAETFVGQQYCPSCGADGRMYEHVTTIVKLMKQAEEERRFERIASIAGRLHGFEPSGPTGRQILADARRCVEEAERNVVRRNRLATLIPTELKAENYERAQNFIEEFRQLNEDTMVYEEELRELPGKIVARDLKRVRQCLKQHDWKTARLLVRNMSTQAASSPEYHEVAAILRRHDRRRSRIMMGVFAGVVLIGYMLSLPLVARHTGETLPTALRVCYSPARWLSEVPGIHALMNSYVKAYGAHATVAGYFKTDEDAEKPIAGLQMADLAVEPPLPDGAEALREEYFHQLGLLEMAQKTEEISLHDAYYRHITDFRAEMQRQGNYDNLVAAELALEHYNETGTIGEIAADTPEILRMEKNRFLQATVNNKRNYARQVVLATKKYTSTLDGMIKNYTMQGQLEQAKRLSDEVKRVKALPGVLAAEELIAASREDGSSEALLLSSNLAMEESLAITTDLREKAENLQKTLADIDAKELKAEECWAAQYVAKLKTLMEHFQQQGDYNALSAAAEELLRYEETQMLTEAFLVAEPQQLRETQQAALKERKTLLSTRDATKLTTYQAYIAELEALQTAYTKKNLLEVAAAVNQALRFTLKDPKYIALVRALPEQAQAKASVPASSVQAETSPLPSTLDVSETEEMPLPSAADAVDGEAEDAYDSLLYDDSPQE